MNKDELVPIAMEYLAQGTTAKSDIYVKYKKPLLMVRSGTLLTARMIDSFHRSASGGRNVYVGRNYYYDLLNHGIPQQLRQEHFERSVGYDVVKKDTDSLLHYLKTTGVVPAERSRRLSQNLSNKISVLDAATIIQCVNGRNNVDEYLCTHSTNVALLNGLMAKWLDMPQYEIDLLVTCGLLHDIGKTEIPHDILNAPRKLTEQEFEIIKQHSVYSYEMLLKNTEIDPLVASAARSHHEKMNGSGYPDGLAGEDIPLYARITSISDVYDAMVSSRCYKDAHSPFIVLNELSIGKFSDLDFDLIDHFLDMMPKELEGRSVLLSDGTIATVKHIDRKKFLYPIVERDGDVVMTSDDVYCKTLVL